MNSFTFTGLLLVLVLYTKYANATPIMHDTTESTVVIKNSSNENQMDNLVYKTTDTTASTDNNKISSHPIVARSPHRPVHRRRRRPRHRKNNTNHSHPVDCRTTTERVPPTTKPTRVHVEFPGIFISHSWGPG